MDTSRAIATATRLIAANGQSVIWRKPAPADPTAKPWRDVRAGDPIDTPVTIVWIASKQRSASLRMLGFLQLTKGTDVPDGLDQALMAAQNFEPELRDCVVIDGVENPLYRVDPIKPNGTPVLYMLYFKRAGA